MTRTSGLYGDSPVNLQHTSGPTGFPKRATLSHTTFSTTVASQVS